MTVRLWDFGGQEVYRITHQFFFSQRALYLVVWKPREGQEQNEVEGWLRRIRLRVGPGARVLIVATHCAEDRHPDLDYPQLQRQFPQMLAGNFEVDNETGHGIAGIAGSHRRAGCTAAADGPEDQLPVGSRSVMRSRISPQTEPQISFQDFVAMCSRISVAMRNRARWLH